MTEKLTGGNFGDGGSDGSGGSATTIHDGNNSPDGVMGSDANHGLNGQAGDVELLH